MDRVIKESNEMIVAHKELEKKTGINYHVAISLFAFAIVKRRIKLNSFK